MRSSAGKLLSHSQWMRNRGARFHVPAPSCDSQKMWNSTAAPPPDENSDQNSIDAGSSMRRPISLWPGMYHSPVTNALWEARRNMFETPTGGEDASRSELAAKTPSRSRTSILYKFSSDFVLREQYRNPWNEIRTGKLVEDLDALAGTISFKHCSSGDGSARSMILVTASVDRIIMKRPIRVDADLSIVGAVTWVGRSSMEMQLQVIQCQVIEFEVGRVTLCFMLELQDFADANHPSESVALEANFTFVARDAKTGKSTPINPVMPETEHEKFLWKEAEERNKLRKQKRAQGKEEQEKLKDLERLNDLLAEGRVFLDMPALADRDSILIKDTSHENSLICQPQQRNIHGRIFGGFLMRKAFELAFSNAYTFAGVSPRFLEVDVGNFLRLKSRILYTEATSSAEPLINIEVVAHVTSPELRSSEVSNRFYFTFSVRPEAMKDGMKIRNVVPGTEEEARRVIERMDAERPIS
uniref:HotDog ACOT-type domain-containing protein n=1 Tax=Brassica campestris TaxID=3711 RepID=M4DYR5_BRACM